MNLIPHVNGSVRLEEAGRKWQLPLGYQGSCVGAEQFLVVPSENAVLFLEQKAELPEEGYELHIELERIVIYGGSEAGIYYGLQTLFQLLEADDGYLLCGVIKDAPRFAHRGFMWDVCRHFFSVADIKKALDECARLKLNVFHWSLSNDQGFRVESLRHPRLNEVGSCRTEADGTHTAGFYTQDEIREVVAYAAARHIEIIPEINMPGHSVAMTASYPELSCSGEPVSVANTGGIYPHILCAGKETTYAFLYDVLDELIELFPGRYFHLGGDEAPKSEWKSCPHCQALMKREGLKNEEELQAYFTEKMIAFLRAKGKTAIVWNEAVQSGRLAPGAIVQYWKEMGECYSYPEVAKGREFIFSNNEEFYFDYPPALVSFKGTYEYEPNMQENYSIPAEQVRGLEAELWTERIASAEQAYKLIFPRLLALAENAWAPAEGKDYAAFLDRVRAYEAHWEKKGLPHATTEEAAICGEEGIRQILQMLQAMAQTGGNGLNLPPEMREALQEMGVKMIAGMMKHSYTQEERDRVVGLIRKALS